MISARVYSKRENFDIKKISRAVGNITTADLPDKFAENNFIAVKIEIAVKLVKYFDNSMEM